MSTNLIYPAICILSLAVGVGVNYGAFKSRLDGHDEDIKDLRLGQQTQERRITENETSIARLEGSLGVR